MAVTELRVEALKLRDHKDKRVADVAHDEDEHCTVLDWDPSTGYVYVVIQRRTGA